VPNDELCVVDRNEEIQAWKNAMSQRVKKLTEVALPVYWASVGLTSRWQVEEELAGCKKELNAASVAKQHADSAAEKQWEVWALQLPGCG